MMENESPSADSELVQFCLSGSQDAWNEFHRRFERLIKAVIRRQLRYHEEYLEDVSQDVLLELVTALRGFDSSYSLAKFVCIVTERVCIDKHRFMNAGKRSAKEESLDQENPDYIESMVLCSNQESPDRQVESAQLAHNLKICLRRLSSRCREILKMRYEMDLPFKKIGEIVGATENTVTVQARRCMSQLKLLYEEMQFSGSGVAP